MRSPFPGMDPYIERTAIWPDFHDSFVAAIRGLLQPQLRPKYVAVIQDRWFVVEADRPILLDVSVVKPVGGDVSAQSISATTALAEVDAPSSVFETWQEEVREPYLEIIEPGSLRGVPGSGGRVITAIEVLSPTNKVGGDGRKSYLQKREEYWDGGANLVEIDLLRTGLRTVRLNEEQLDSLPPHPYLAAISRRQPARHEVYAIPLDRHLPRIPIPLSNGDRDVSLDLQAALVRTWDEGPYPELLRYEEDPPADLTADEQAWCRQRLRDAGFATER